MCWALKISRFVSTILADGCDQFWSSRPYLKAGKVCCLYPITLPVRSLHSAKTFIQGS